jgi:hypothetical protein
MPEEIPGGYQIWGVENSGEHAHTFLLLWLPAPATVEQLTEFFLTGTLPTEIDISTMTPAGSVGLVSAGRSIWAGFDLSAGSYALICYAIAADGTAHFELGEIAVFTVLEPEPTS